MMQRISLIAAISENKVIGIHNRLPWRMPADHRHFHAVTKGHPFIMGRLSYLSEDRLLSTERSIILSHHANDPLCANCERAESLGEALSILSAYSEIFILGGARVFRQSLSIANYMYLTIIHAHIKGDAFFPQFSAQQWTEVRTSHHLKDKENPYDYSFIEYARKGYN